MSRSSRNAGDRNAQGFEAEAGPMMGLMQDRPLLISSLIEHAALYHPKKEIVTRTIEGPILRSTYSEICARAKRIANALTGLGVKQGDRVGTLAWNTHRHMELYYAVSGMGAVLHTVNPRLFPEQVEYIVNHAEDGVVFFDITFADLVAQLAPRLKTVKMFVALTDRAHMPAVDLPGMLCYEELIEGHSENYAWPEFDERQASSLCYTSGTTGNPKGVLYSHRSTILHTLKVSTGDGFGISGQTSLLLVVPLFHANGWGMPYACVMGGAKMVLPGRHLDGQSLYELMRDEQCNYSAAVPTVWLMLFEYLDAHPEIDRRSLGLRKILTGGSAPPLSMMERMEHDFGAEVFQAWGMTETSPIGACNIPLPEHAALPLEQRRVLKTKAGRGTWGVELKIVDDEGCELPHDGKAFGQLKVRGPWIASGYFKAEGGHLLDADGFFPTGDVATIDPDGYLRLVDRSKDVIKSGGEWISSIDVENVAVAHPAIAEAALIGVHHPKWQERPLLVAVKRQGATVTREEVLEYLSARMAKWWVPDDVVFVSELPHTATGKLSKVRLREQFREYRLVG